MSANIVVKRINVSLSAGREEAILKYTTILAEKSNEVTVGREINSPCRWWKSLG